MSQSQTINSSIAESVSRSSIYRYYRRGTDSVIKERNCFPKNSKTIKVCKFSLPATPEEISFSASSISYIFDTSTFIALQSYVEDYGYSIIDIPFSKLLKESSDALRIIANAINFRKCFVTKGVFAEIIKAESDGKLRRGTSHFVEDYFGIVDNEEPLPANTTWQEWLQSPNSSMQKHKDKHYKLIWDAITLIDERHPNVYVITLSQKFIDLGMANDIGVLSPWKIKYSL